MRTPAGVECALYYQDHHRGLDVVECRVARTPNSKPWTESDCTRCPVPSILLANGSPDLQLELAVRRGFLGIGQRIYVEATCAKHGSPIPDPHLGCPACAAEMLDGVDLQATAEGFDDV